MSKETPPTAVNPSDLAQPEQYVYIGPSGDIVNQEIECDRKEGPIHGKIIAPTSDRQLEARLQEPITGKFMMQEHVKALGTLLARDAEELNVRG